MKTILVSALIALSLFPLSVKSQTINFPIPCTDIDNLAEVLEKHGEKAAMTMTSSREVGGRILNSATVLFINFETKTWTLAEQITDEKYCVIALGDDIKPYLKQ